MDEPHWRLIRPAVEKSIELCRADSQDLRAAMVSAGMTWAFTDNSSDYVDQERAGDRLASRRARA
jgi:endonuclease YncB( thermonuclease family)